MLTNSLTLINIIYIALFPVSAVVSISLLNYLAQPATPSPHSGTNLVTNIPTQVPVEIPPAPIQPAVRELTNVEKQLSEYLDYISKIRGNKTSEYSLFEIKVINFLKKTLATLAENEGAITPDISRALHRSENMFKFLKLTLKKFNLKGPDQASVGTDWSWSQFYEIYYTYFYPQSALKQQICEVMQLHERFTDFSAVVSLNGKDISSFFIEFDSAIEKAQELLENGQDATAVINAARFHLHTGMENSIEMLSATNGTPGVVLVFLLLISFPILTMVIVYLCHVNTTNLVYIIGRVREHIYYNISKVLELYKPYINKLICSNFFIVARK